jgi:hypothetical protein
MIKQQRKRERMVFQPLPIARSLPTPGERTSTREPSPPYLLRFPVGKEHIITVTSNKDMTPAAWAIFERLICLQRDIWTDDAQGIEAAEASGTTKIGSTEGESPVVADDAPNPSLEGQ